MARIGSDVHRMECILEKITANNCILYNIGITQAKKTKHNNNNMK